MGVGVIINAVVLISASRRDEIVELVQYVLFQPLLILVEHQRGGGVRQLNHEQTIFYTRLPRRLQHLVGEVYYLSLLAA